MDDGDLEERLNAMERTLRSIPVRWAGGGQAAPNTVPIPWVQMTVDGGNTLLVSGTNYVYGVKRKVGEAKPTTWIGASRRATATCTVAGGGIATVTLTDPGVGYTVAPIVTLSPYYSPAEITATLSTEKKVAAVQITACGTGYNAPPTVIFSAPGGGGTTATGTAVVRDGLVVAVNVTNPGSKYTSPPSITLTPTDGGASAVAAPLMDTGAITLAITNAGTGYSTPPTITIAAPTQSFYPGYPTVSDGTPSPWADGIGAGTIAVGALVGGVTAGPALVCHDDRSLLPWDLMGPSTGPAARYNDTFLSWYYTYMRLTTQDANADGILGAWVPMGVG